jgi:hypothetical protein
MVNMRFFHGIIIGFTIALGVAGIISVSIERRAWNKAVDKSASITLLHNNKFGGLDTTYDLGFKRCQEESFDIIKELKRE